MLRVNTNKVTGQSTHFDEQFRLAVEASPTAMIMVDMNGTIVLSNSVTEKLFGYSHNELLGKPIEILLPEKYRRDHLAYRSEFHSSPVARPMGKGRDLNGRHKNGTDIPLEIGLNPLETTNGMCVLASIIDLRERKSQEERLRNSLHEKEILLKEIHHRVKNNLQVVASLLDLQANYARDPETKGLFRESRDRIHAISIIHERLYRTKNLDRIHLGDYLHALASDLFDSYGTNRERINLIVTATPVAVNIDTANCCGLIVHELISNSLKHAFHKNDNGKVSIDVRTRDNNGSPQQIIVTVSDNGGGFPASIDYRETESLGLQLVITLIEQLQGKIELDATHGTSFRLTFSELQYKERVPAPVSDLEEGLGQP